MVGRLPPQEPFSRAQPGFHRCARRDMTRHTLDEMYYDFNLHSLDDALISATVAAIQI
jgi:hypothetical protein